MSCTSLGRRENEKVFKRWWCFCGSFGQTSRDSRDSRVTSFSVVLPKEGSPARYRLLVNRQELVKLTAPATWTTSDLKKAVEIELSKAALWVQKMPSQTGTTGAGRFIFPNLPNVFFLRYPVFLTHSLLDLPGWLIGKKRVGFG